MKYAVVGIVGFLVLVVLMFNCGKSDASHLPPAYPVCGDYRPVQSFSPAYRAMGDGVVDINDIISILAPVRRFGTSIGEPNYHPAWDRVPPDGILAYDINIQDLVNIQDGRPLPIECEGRVRFQYWMGSSFDYVTRDPVTLIPNLAGQAMVNQHYHGGIVFPSASGDNACCQKSWFVGQQWVYLIWERMERLIGHNEHGVGFPLTPAQHGLTNLNGVPCEYGNTNDHIVDFGDLDFRAKLIAYYQDAFNDFPFYDGIYADDFNIGLKEMNCDGNNMNGNCASPYTSLDCPRDPDNPTPTQMTLDQWTGRAADLAEAIDQAFTRQFMVNTQPGGGYNYGSANHLRILNAVDFTEVEHGLDDTLLNWTLVDLAHANGASVVYQVYDPDDPEDGVTEQEQLFGLASYLLIANGKDLTQSFYQTLPEEWDSIWETDLGPALGPRFLEGGVWKRNFEGGTVTVNIGTGTGTIP